MFTRIPSIVGALLLFGSFASAKKNLNNHDAERAILREFYEATNGNGWNDNTGWAHDTPNVCEWTGIECSPNPDNSKVQDIIGVYLGDNFLKGRTTPSLWKLPKLQTIDLSYNPGLDVDFGSLVDLDAKELPALETINVRQTGTTSAKGVSTLANTLTKLVLSDCAFESQFPPDLLDLRKLETLSLSGCSLRGNLPDDMDKLSQLRVLDFYDNDLTGTLPDSMASLVHLRSLILSKNQLHGKLPQWINDELVMLEQFWVNFNDLTGEILAFDKQPSMQKLYLNGNEFTGEIPSTFLQAAIDGPEGAGKTGDTIMINLGKNEFTGVIPGHLDRLAYLPITWRFGGNQWTGVAPELCDNVNWQDGSIREYGCQGLICPPNFYSAEGYYTEDNPCERCSTSEYFGTFECFDRDDRAVLRDIYAKLGGDNWIHNEGWKDAPKFVADDDYSEEWYDYCYWYGIECWELGDGKDYRVRKIELGNNNLVGDMPETLFAIEHLTTLDVSNNPELTMSFWHIGWNSHLYSINVGGTKTQDYDGIQHASSNFRRLYADNTPIAGTIPREITRIRNLEVLSLQECQLNGNLPNQLFRMDSLEELYLTNNNFQGVLPDKWGSLPALEVLALAKNSFQGALPDSFGYSPSLRAISLKDQVSKGGGITGNLPSFRKSQTLHQIILADNKLDGTLPEDLLIASEGYTRDEDLNTLYHIDLTNNKITGTVSGSYERFKQLDLYLEGNLISEIDERLCKMPNPDWMSGGVGAFGCEAILCPLGTYNHGGRRMYNNDSCSPCKIKTGDSSAPAFLGQSSCGDESKDVEDLQVMTPEEIEAANVANSAAEQTLEFSILEAFFKATGGYKDLWTSKDGWIEEADFCTWYGVDCDENGSVSSIQLGSNGLKGKLPSDIWKLPNLAHLKIYGNSVEVDFEGIENARNLKTLGLDDTGLKSVEGIGKARSLVKLNLSYNGLVGNLPDDLANLINLEELDVSHNKFTGSMPFWIRNLIKLQSFTAGHNSISGRVMDFTTMPGITFIDLSYNQLSGSLPESLLARSSRVEKIVLDLSHNQIEGTVPRSLAKLQRLSLQLNDNKISEIDEELCYVTGMNDFGVLNYGCDGILCPIGTYNALGRQTTDEVPCNKCRKAKFMGSTTCGNKSSASSRFSTSGIVALLVSTAVALLL